MAERNMHAIDRLLRVTLAEVLILGAYFWLQTPWTGIAYTAAFFLLLTAATGICYVYLLTDINTYHRWGGKRFNKLIKGILIYAIVLVPVGILYKEGVEGAIQRDLLIATAIGFIAQIIDGSLGMAYGISSNTFLISMGIPPVASSASVHTAEIFTAGAEGIAHLRAGNVDRHILKYLIISGGIGAYVGAYVLTRLPIGTLKPFIAIYLLIMGILIVEKAFEKKPLIIRAFLALKDALHMEHGEKWGRKLLPFGLIGGALDSVGGGGWGPLITLTLFFKGENLRLAIGSVIFTEFFVALVASVTFLTALKLEYWHTIVGLMIGGLLAVPLGPYLTKKLPYKPLMILVGVTIVILSLRTIYPYLAGLF